MLNDSNTLGLITSYPAKNGEIASENAISRYSYLLVRSIFKNQKVVIFSEKNSKNNIPYHFSDNVLITPTYKFNSMTFCSNILSKVLEFNRIKDYLIQFEFSIFGGKKVIPSFLITLLGLKILGKRVSITLHQIATNLNELSGHLGLRRNSLKTKLLNISLSVFYRTVGLLVNKIIVHDNLLKNRLSMYVNQNKIDVIPHAVGDESFKKVTPRLRSVIRKSYGFNKKDRVVVAYGYRSWYKGTDWIVKNIKEIVVANPKENIKLLVAGGESPTLKDTASYKRFDRKLRNLVKEAKGTVKVTGFVPEKEVWKVFAVSDVVVFPYRTRMSASGAFSLTLAYKKPFLVSNHFALGSEVNLSQSIFDLNAFSFEKALFNIFHKRGVNKLFRNLTLNLSKGKSWQEVASLYIESIKSVKINSNAYMFKKTFELAKV